MIRSIELLFLISPFAYAYVSIIKTDKRTDFQGKLFDGSKYLLAYADTLVELKTICEHPGCSRKATMIARYQDGKLVLEGQQIDIGGDKYKVFCRKHYRKLTDLI